MFPSIEGTRDIDKLARSIREESTFYTTKLLLEQL